MNVRAPKVYRGSKKRLRSIRLRGSGSLALWVFIVMVLFSLFIVLPWLIVHADAGPAFDTNQLRVR
jgi:hypothetical protein